MPRGHQARLRSARSFARSLLRQLRPQRSESASGDGEQERPTRKRYKHADRFKSRRKKIRDLEQEIEGVPTLFELKDILYDENKSIEFLRKKGVINIPTTCDRCSSPVGQDWTRHQVRCQKTNCMYRPPVKCELCPCGELQQTTTSLGDQGVRCTAEECGWEWSPGKCCTRSFFRNSVLERCHLPKNEVVHLIYLWLNKATNTQVCQQLGWNSETAGRWLKYCRQLVTEMIVTQPHVNNMIGGHDVIVEIDESKMARRKYNRGRRVKGSWVLGMVERTAERRMVLVVVDSRDKKTLEHSIKTFVHPGSTIHTDMWKGYIGLERIGYTHKTLCHKYEFVAEDGTHTQTVEGNWTPLKKAIPVQCREGADLQDYLFEYMWRRKNLGRQWEAMWQGLARVRLTRRELQVILQERENSCEDDDDDYCPVLDSRLDAEEDEAGDTQWGDFGDDTFTPDTDDEGENNGNGESTDEDVERMTETIAYEVISELMAGGAIDRSIFFDEQGNQFGII
ncbi:Inherit from opiNOG: protein Hydra magnipapillata [Seminavis robusta]|uniref:Inherit from opiNOG: protein Hydra magnipapillata n=1 Tax=Seminavis robusta TaxID=568900 RepID=A0A9N8H866_9STRA|nr:Inherit from opiNOG: protein Hydra magnipapillata [Seminavis robusta]|eukprot:Sro228_g092750.1 Inherit from opiNOG: protein Hydra magnipapillata (508) ;mRNA; f:62322-63845